ncbi:MAG: hypothetical protein U0228_39770 [Myxococcaceae bacterium]
MTRFVCSLALLSAVALAAPPPKQLVLAYQGDDGGEVAPCG